jgi:hypothetical protein
MAECHPVGFQWVMEAKARGATVIHLDPRFTRTSALADLHVPLRAGSDIALLGGLINYVLSTGKFFREYVASYTNAATIISEDFADTEDLDGLFSGFAPQDSDSDSVQQAGRGEAHGSGGAHVGTPTLDPTLTHQRCVFQMLKRHFARYTPEMVERACGVPQDALARRRRRSPSRRRPPSRQQGSHRSHRSHRPDAAAGDERGASPPGAPAPQASGPGRGSRSGLGVPALGVPALGVPALGVPALALAARARGRARSPGAGGGSGRCPAPPLLAASAATRWGFSTPGWRPCATRSTRWSRSGSGSASEPRQLTRH